MSKLSRPIDDQDHLFGPDDAVFEIVEYGDFGCPYCAAAYPVLQELLQRMGDQILFAYRNFPLSEIHPYAEAAAEAAEAAAAQGKFWEMHSYLFEHQNKLTESRLPDFAKAVGLDVSQFQKDLSSHTFAARVHNDFLSGVYSGVNGTPTLFINNQRYDGPVDLESLLAALQHVKEQSSR